MAAAGALRRVLGIVLVFGSQIPPSARGDVTLCSCDLSPGNCDLNCCCDPECGPAPFSSCLPGSTRAERWVCMSSWLIFRNNTPYTTARLGSPPAELFCVLSVDASLNYFVTPRKVGAADFLSLSEPHAGPSFSPSSQSGRSFSGFYRAGDPVLTVSSSGTIGVLRLPAPTGLQNICADNNPAKFLQGGSTSCLRVFTNLSVSCEGEPGLDSAHYSRDVSVLRVPSDAANPEAKLIPVISSASVRPALQGDQCHNVVTQVTYTVRYNGSQGIVNVSADLTLGAASGSSLQQTFTIIYQPVSAAGGSSVQTRSGNPGYLTGHVVLSDAGALSVPRSQGGESCARSPLLFGINTLSGCVLSGTAQDSCSDFQARAYHTLLAGGAPQSLAMFGNATSTQSGSWTPIIQQNCSSSQGDCASGCLIPVSLDIQILWANVGLLSNPQAQLLRARFLYTCRTVRCQDSALLQTRVSFTDLTTRGPAPRSRPPVTDTEPSDFFFPFRSSSEATPAGNLLLTLLLLLL